MLSVFNESVTFDSVLSLERYSPSITLRHHVAAMTKHGFLTGNDAFFRLVLHSVPDPQRTHVMWGLGKVRVLLWVHWW